MSKYHKRYAVYADKHPLSTYCGFAEAMDVLRQLLANRGQLAAPPAHCYVLDCLCGVVSRYDPTPEDLDPANAPLRPA